LPVIEDFVDAFIPLATIDLHTRVQTTYSSLDLHPQSLLNPMADAMNPKLLHLLDSFLQHAITSGLRIHSQYLFVINCVVVIEKFTIRQFRHCHHISCQKDLHTFKEYH
jgi:hypothetical protein